MVIMLVYEVFLGFPWDFYRTNCTKVYYWRSQDQTKSQPLPSSGVDWDGDSCWGFNKPTWGYSLQFYDRKMGYNGIYRDRLITRYMMFGCANRRFLVRFSGGISQHIPFWSFLRVEIHFQTRIAQSYHCWPHFLTESQLILDHFCPLNSMPWINLQFLCNDPRRKIRELDEGNMLRESDMFNRWEPDEFPVSFPLFQSHKKGDELLSFAA